MTHNRTHHFRIYSTPNNRESSTNAERLEVQTRVRACVHALRIDSNTLVLEEDGSRTDVRLLEH